MEKITNVFSCNPSQAMSLLMENRNALIIMSNIIVKKDFIHYGVGVDYKLNEGECFFSLRNVKTKPKMTDSQMKTALKNLVYYGFIEILEFKPICRISGLKKIKILINPFSEEVSKIAREYDPSFR